eukprot:TRINITY_DN67456_c0_g1_i1.p1 TRINITY_DN67456_c0_g1~~TRINITY_DN67456_c0_g1_i1.p1  ORF type:complete len:585 (-),score=83.52 TRINITY_DN67456_c0_g1_i1:90-1844(-)
MDSTPPAPGEVPRSMSESLAPLVLPLPGVHSFPPVAVAAPPATVASASPGAPTPAPPVPAPSEWQCGICRQGYPTELMVANHLRDTHGIALSAVPLVSVGATTWNREAHNLFDRKASSQHVRQALVVPVPLGSQPLRFLRDSDGVRVQFAGTKPNGPPSTDASSMHMQLAWREPLGQLTVEQTPKSASRARGGPDRVSGSAMWLNVGAEGHRLKEGDLFKIGRFKVTVRQIYLRGPAKLPDDSSEEGLRSVVCPEAASTPGSNGCTASESRCRICLGGGTPPPSPMASRAQSFHTTAEVDDDEVDRAHGRARLRRWRTRGQTKAGHEDEVPESARPSARSSICTPSASGTAAAEDASVVENPVDDDLGAMSDVPCQPVVQSQDDEEDPLILAPCMCRGAAQHVHLGCLRQWLTSRFSVESWGSRYISFKPPGCEICMTEFPVTIQAPGSSSPVPLLPKQPMLPKIPPPFIVLSIPKSSGDDRSRPFGERFVFAPGDSDAVLRIGRAREAELRVSDVTVSRVHATIAAVDGDFMLRDNNAKFQTLVLPRGPNALQDERGKALSVQAGRTVLSFSLLDLKAYDEWE